MINLPWVLGFTWNVIFINGEIYDYFLYSSWLFIFIFTEKCINSNSSTSLHYSGEIVQNDFPKSKWCIAFHWTLWTISDGHQRIDTMKKKNHFASYKRVFAVIFAHLYAVKFSQAQAIYVISQVKMLVLVCLMPLFSDVVIKLHAVYFHNDSFAIGFIFVFVCAYVFSYLFFSMIQVFEFEKWCAWAKIVYRTNNSWISIFFLQNCCCCRWSMWFSQQIQFIRKQKL